MEENGGFEPPGLAIRSRPECDRTLRILRLFSVYAQPELHRSRRSGVTFTGSDLYLIPLEAGRGRLERPSVAKVRETTRYLPPRIIIPTQPPLSRDVHTFNLITGVSLLKSAGVPGNQSGEVKL